ncbi:hypothetical protein F4821DRAFT_5091 [Hypoxylon rubiginosum]|uniref:Uncharacterized protein n=1 Tax=Hypoxylon rubiginosum TaxID=110542 RepID=A0ACC0DLX5_9PEZI|nr:hypothetical protein F4821DRAFT_5091 [Hypoxylon rubiginosum]
MLSSIGRAAVKRLVSTTAATSLHRIAVPRLVANTPKPNHAFIRSFATPGRPKASTKQNATKKPVAKQAKSTKSETTPELIPKRVVRRRKPLTPEKEAILEKRELKKTALLSEPKSLPVIPWTVFVKEETNHKDVPDAIGLRGRMGQLAQDYKNLPASELQRLTNVAEENKVTYAATYKAWVESHTAAEIRAAIKARQLLKRKFNYPPTRTSKTIHDDRIPKRPLNAFSLFTKARWASGDYAQYGSVPEATKVIAKEWKNLPRTERQAYDDLAKANTEQYNKEVKSAF